MESDREQSPYTSAATPLMQSGTLASEFNGPGAMRDGEPSSYTGSNTHSDLLAEKRDQEAAARMPRSSDSWEKEQERPGSWQGGRGTLRQPGIGRPNILGQARPLFQQRGT